VYFTEAGDSQFVIDRACMVVLSMSVYSHQPSFGEFKEWICILTSLSSSRPAQQIQSVPARHTHRSSSLIIYRARPRPRPAAAKRPGHQPTKFPTGFDVFRPIHHTSSPADRPDQSRD